MNNTIEEVIVYDYPEYNVYDAAEGAVKGLEGKMLSQDKTAGRMEVRFNKTILGKVLGERTFLEIKVVALTSDQSRVELSAYPLDAIGRKLMFGARKGVTQTILNWFKAHLAHRLQQKTN